MSSWTMPAPRLRTVDDGLSDPDRRSVLIATGLALAFVLLTRWPVARSLPMEPDEFSFVEEAAVHWFPMHHTLFKTMGRVMAIVTGDAYRGFVTLDMVSSALALVSLWWWLRAVVSPRTAAAGTLLLGVGPDFWGYGAMAGNYTAIVLVGSFLMGVAIRGHRRPESWQPIAAAAVLALGTGYRTDLGLLWMPVFLVILWQHRWKPAMLAGLSFAAINLAWAGAMLVEVGGWDRYVEATSAFAHSAGTLNSYWHLGLVDGPMRYAVKLAMALVWTLGPALLFVPRGVLRLRRIESGPFLAVLIALSVLPALATHLLLHFGVAGYCFHYVPALMAMVVLGVGRGDGDSSAARLLGLAGVLAALFLFYPTDFSAPGWRGDFDLSFCRLTRHGLNATIPRSSPTVWRTANSRGVAAPTAVTE